MNEKIKTILGDITKQKVDAIVNAANTSLLRRSEGSTRLNSSHTS